MNLKNSLLISPVIRFLAVLCDFCISFDLKVRSSCIIFSSWLVTDEICFIWFTFCVWQNIYNNNENTLYLWNKKWLTGQVKNSPVLVHCLLFGFSTTKTVNTGSSLKCFKCEWFSFCQLLIKDVLTGQWRWNKNATSINCVAISIFSKVCVIA